MDPSRFDAAVEDWLQYQANGPGQIRGELLWRGLARHLPREAASVLDVGGGTGELAIRLARAGHHVTVVDFSPAMLVAARTRTDGLDVRCLVGRAEELSPQALGVFEVVTCHSVLEFTDDPSAVLAACARCLAPNGLLSVAFGNSRYLPLKTAVTTGAFRRARDEAEGRGEALDCFGLPKRLFRAETITALLGHHGFKTTAEYRHPRGHGLAPPVNRGCAGTVRRADVPRSGADAGRRLLCGCPVCAHCCRALMCATRWPWD